jgi:hypothetical protein
LVADGPSTSVVDKYLTHSGAAMTGVYDFRESKARAEGLQTIIVGCRVLDERGRATATVSPLQTLRIEVDLDPSTPMRSPMVSIGFESVR